VFAKDKCRLYGKLSTEYQCRIRRQYEINQIPNVSIIPRFEVEEKPRHPGVTIIVDERLLTASNFSGGPLTVTSGPVVEMVDDRHAPKW
jgi:hypothetical protein